MKLFAVLEPFFGALNDGRIIRITFAWVLRVLAVAGAIGGLAAGLIAVATGFRAADSMNAYGRSPASLLIAVFVLGAVCFAIGYAWLGLCWFRAKSVLELGETHFTVLSIVSILFRLAGELNFAVDALLGVAGCLFIWLTNVSPLNFLPLNGDLPFASQASSGFVGGIEFLFLMLLGAFFSFVFAYALAELTIVLVEIAVNTRKTPESPATVVREPLAAAMAPAAKACPSCGTGLEPGAVFCAECGGRVN